MRTSILITALIASSCARDASTDRLDHDIAALRAQVTYLTERANNDRSLLATIVCGTKWNQRLGSGSDNFVQYGMSVRDVTIGSNGYTVDFSRARIWCGDPVQLAPAGMPIASLAELQQAVYKVP